MSWTRSRRHSIRRNPAPYISEAISHLSPVKLAEHGLHFLAGHHDGQAAWACGRG